MSASNDVIFAYLPSASCVALNINYNKPDKMTPQEEDVWMEQSRSEALYLKGKLELGVIKADTIIDRLMVNVLPKPFPKEVEEYIIEELTGMHCSSAMDKNFRDITKQIRESVTVTKGNTEQCLQLLEQYKQLPKNKLLLIAHPRSVGTIRNLRSYIGNISAWTLTNAEEVYFMTQAVKIRKEANAIYASIKAHFQPTPPSSFWQYYIRMSMVYKAYINQQRQQ